MAMEIFLSTLSLRRATQHYGSFRDLTVISIHALLAESDLLGDQRASLNSISIHALLAESDTTMGGAGTTTLPFLSTLSLRRATRYWGTRSWRLFNFYPRSPCGERPSGSASIPRYLNFYPRSPCGERRSIG